MGSILRPTHLEDKYHLDKGQVFITGTQALVRLPLIQKRLDLRHNLKTAGFISGYRGSPLGGLDLALWKAKSFLTSHHVHFQPGLNEDLAATAVWGTQQTMLSPGSQVQGVFSMWYGKGPGVDRSGDVLKHANFAGTTPYGGVLALAGDDHACKSSTLPHQTEYAFLDAFIPVFHPATVQDILDLGIYGWALSRYSGLWVCLKMLSDTVDTACSVLVDIERYTNFKIPQDYSLPPGGLGLRWPDTPLDQERRMIEEKMPALSAFLRANPLNKSLWSSQEKSSSQRIGFVAVGKAYLELMEALQELGITQNNAPSFGVDVFKVMVSWPLEKESILSFCKGRQEIIVVEEKRPFLENQLKEILYHLPASERPRILGKTTDLGAPFFPGTYELDTTLIRNILRKHLKDLPGFEQIKKLWDKEEVRATTPSPLSRIPYYCSGCPHNTSTTQIPQGSRAMAGIGCHYMATWIHDRTTTFTQMGGEGVPWIGTAPFTSEPHIFSNIGDGTYYHSGLLAIRASVAAKVNITYKILYNDAVAMTGGQPVDGPLTVADITHQLYAERVRSIALITDEPHKYPKNASFAAGVTIHHRKDLGKVQEQFRKIPGTTAIIYDQTCAAEKRRRRKRGTMEEPNRFLFINEAVCEGCGDCSRKSNCLSVLPLKTEWGTKRAIDQSSCNKDFSCLNGFCPSFVSIIGGERKKPAVIPLATSLFNNLPAPHYKPLGTTPYNIFITGVGGTGVVTIGALIGMAAHLEGKGCSVVDMAGLAQKGGAVVSHLKISLKPEDILSPRIGNGKADLLLGFDLVVSAGEEALRKINPLESIVLINDHETITGRFPQDPDTLFPNDTLKNHIKENTNNALLTFFDAQSLAAQLLGDSLMSNLFLVGYALQKGFIPISVEALEESIRLNNISVETNLQALNWGRLMAVDEKTVRLYAAQNHTLPEDHRFSETLEEMIARRTRFLKEYQNEAYAQIYDKIMLRVRQKEAELGTDKLTRLIGQTLYRVMAYKDEYEVARLYTNGKFEARLKEQFQGNYKIYFHLAPPLIARKNEKGELEKLTFGPWVFYLFKLLAKGKGLRGTPFDIFGYTRERRRERHLITTYKAVIEKVLALVTHENVHQLAELAALPQKIRGFGHVKEKNHQSVMLALEAFLETSSALSSR